MVARTFMSEAPSYMRHIYSQIVAEPTFDPRSGVGTMLLIVFAFCALIVNSTYTAKLTETLGRPPANYPVGSLAEVTSAQTNGRMGAVCVMGSTAYARWVTSNFPEMTVHEVAGSSDQMVAAMQRGACDGIVDVWPHTQAVATDVIDAAQPHAARHAPRSHPRTSRAAAHSMSPARPTSPERTPPHPICAHIVPTAHRNVTVPSTSPSVGKRSNSARKTWPSVCTSTSRSSPRASRIGSSSCARAALPSADRLATIAST
jgi:hypothetical protein